jgi:threonine dehydrogenase-like Zn-dependent dehydrogenase
MCAAVIHAPFDIRVDPVPDPVVREPSDAVVRVTHSCICGSDLWADRGVAKRQPGQLCDLDPSAVFDQRMGPDGVPDGYASMNGRSALKVLVVT